MIQIEEVKNNRTKKVVFTWALIIGFIILNTILYFIDVGLGAICSFILLIVFDSVRCSGVIKLDK